MANNVLSPLGKLADADFNSLLDRSLCTNPTIPFGNTFSTSANTISLSWSRDLLDAALFIVSNGTYQNNGILSNRNWSTKVLVQVFQQIAEWHDNPLKQYDGLIKAYAYLYDIDLNIIACVGRKFIVINKNSFPRSRQELDNRKNQAFLLHNADKTSYASLFVHDINGCKQTVFAIDDTRIRQVIDDYVRQLNETSLTPNSGALTQSTSSLKLREFGEQTLQQLFQLFDGFAPSLDGIPMSIEPSDFNLDQLDRTSPQSFIRAFQKRCTILSKVFERAADHMSKTDATILPEKITSEDTNTQLVSGQSSALSVPNSSFNYSTSPDETNLALQNVQVPIVTPATPLTHLSSSTQVNSTLIVGTTTPIQFPYEQPEILHEPKSKQRCRTINELAKKGCPRLQGIGFNQREPIRVKVPPKGKHSIYLSIEVRTYDDRKHLYKIIVPDKTRVDRALITHENNLHCLQFDKCRGTDYFDFNTQRIYLKITDAEHKDLSKNVRIHMVKLYQNSTITRELIRTGQLNLCKLAFWLSEFKNGTFQPVSSQSFSTIIRE